MIRKFRGMSSSASTAAIAAALALAACAAIPPARLADIKPVSAYGAQQSFAGAASAWPGDDWWRAYEDPQLNTVIDEALQNAPNVAMARARLGKADALVGESRANLLPTLQGQAEVAGD